ncbi:MAG: helix-turn-helix domain-containing protein [archaeon]
MQTAFKNEQYRSIEDLPAVFGVKILSQFLGINVNKGYELVKRKNFPAKKIGRKYLIYKENLDEWLRRVN